MAGAVPTSTILVAYYMKATNDLTLHFMELSRIWTFEEKECQLLYMYMNMNSI